MSGKRRKKQNAWQNYTGIVCNILVGAVCGVWMVTYADSMLQVGSPRSEIILTLAGMFFFLYAAILVHIIIHEAGHMAFGLLSGYRFVSFRILSFMWIKESGKIKLRKLSVVGTGGQCLMEPPGSYGEKIPVVLYNLGGPLTNIIAGFFFIFLYASVSEKTFLSTVLMIFAFVGFASALLNGIPMRMGTVDNDGYNAWSLCKDDNANRAFWVQFKINAIMAQGKRLDEMPEEWFSLPSDEAMKNNIVAAIGVFACNRMMEMHQFEEADRQMEHLLAIDSGMVGLHRRLLVCDRIYCGLILGKGFEKMEQMYTKEQKKFMKSMKRFPSVLRTEYTLALLVEKNDQKATLVKKQFEQCALTYPYPGDIESERKLMEIAMAHSHLPYTKSGG